MPLPGTKVHPLAVRCPSMTPLPRSLSLSLQGVHKAGSPPQHLQATITSGTRLTCSAGLRGHLGVVGPEEPTLCRLPCPDTPPGWPGPPPHAAALLLRTCTRRGPRRPLPPSARSLPPAPRNPPGTATRNPRPPRSPTLRPRKAVVLPSEPAVPRPPLSAAGPCRPRPPSVFPTPSSPPRPPERRRAASAHRACAQNGAPAPKEGGGAAPALNSGALAGLPAPRLTRREWPEGQRPPGC
ncbi:uncharacterized protein LOC128803161 [Vidua macroura]|uniref:uncharacterized protein LOC128803161 n=1 Tax=Vidua macroura TaxID=187451 RepID=UPI0023A8E1AE|nr:uncharacterized protein LOC128803161 [Vidua macroura]